MDSKRFEIEHKNRPHVVILGAGASVAVLSSDKRGIRIPAMNGFLQASGLSHLLEDFRVETKSNNLEDIYSELFARAKTDPAAESVLKSLEEGILEYMRTFSLPDDVPTIYDFLVASLTKKDVIATFNWDPMILHAYSRAKRYGIKEEDEMPHLVFLHGNSRVGYCDKCKIATILNNDGTQTCPECGRPILPSRLLYPIREKNYRNDLHIKNAWDNLSFYLKRAYQITIFGYGAPKSDAAAMGLIKRAYGDANKRELDEINIIDIKDEGDLIDSFSDLIFEGHYRCFKSFFDSPLATCPRRTNEYLFDVTMNCFWGNIDKGFREGMSFEDIEKVIAPRLAEERSSKPGEILFDPYLACHS